MARYGSFKYGGGTTGAKYGLTATTLTRWGFIVDWDSDGYFTGENEADRMIGFSLTRGRESYIKANGGGLERYRPGVIVATFDNSDGRYNPYNTSSPLYPNVAPGKLVDARNRYGTAATYGSLMRGKITDINNYRQNNRPITQITVMDGLQFLNDQTMSLGLEGLQVDNLVNTRILPEAGWPDVAYRGWPIWPGTTTELIQQWAIWNQNALDAIHELEDVELGHFLHTQDGYGRFVPSDYTYFATTTITEEDCLRDIVIPSPWEVVRNVVRVNVYPRRYVTVNDTVFELDSPALVAAGETVEIDAEFTYAGKRTIGQTPTYTIAVNTASDGSGTNITSSCTILPDTNPGYGARVFITNHTAAAGYVITLTVDVVNVSYVTNPVSIVVEDTASQAVYGKRVLTLDSPVMADTAYAKAVAEWLLLNLKNPQPWPIIQLENQNLLQYSPFLYTSRIHLQLPSLAIDGYYRIGQVKHDWLIENGQGVRTTYHLEPYFTPFTG